MVANELSDNSRVYSCVSGECSEYYHNHNLDGHISVYMIFKLLLWFSDPRWDKYLKLINLALNNYKECTKDDCSCHFEWVYNH